MTNTKTREQILENHTGREWYKLTHETALAAMSEYSSHQNKELLERIKELEEGLAKIARGPLIGESNRFSDHVVRIAKQLLNNKTDKE